ncbi:MAG: ABC transporter permease [Armatimonadetes bacterium]|nr:ABC transporter permease [Armatimonadota bacterium]MDW8123101.1 ABC transporter permease [Armatimonadota bacterium]
MRRIFSAGGSQEVGLLLFIVVVALVTWWREPSFLSSYNIQVITREAGLFGTMAIGQTLVILSGGIDLSPGSLVALSGVLVAYLLAMAQWSFVSAVAVVLLLGFLTGLWHGLFVTKLSVPPFIITLGTLSAARGAAVVICTTVAGGQAIGNLPASFSFWGQGVVLQFLPVPVAVCLIVAVAFGWLLYRLRWGRYIVATGGNLLAARLSGVPVDQVRISCYIASSVLCSLVGILTASYVNSGEPTVGAAWELYVIAAVVIGGTSLSGGTGTLWGSLLGALFMSVLKNSLLFWNVPAHWHDVVIGAIVVAAVTLDQVRRRRSPKF